MPLPLAWKPERGRLMPIRGYGSRPGSRLKAECGPGASELLPGPGFGLTILPAPSAGDVFFDLEGDPFAGEGGLEYLFGVRLSVPMGLDDSGDWVFSRADEKKAFEHFMDFVRARLKQYPDSRLSLRAL